MNECYQSEHLISKNYIDNLVKDNYCYFEKKNNIKEQLACYSCLNTVKPSHVSIFSDRIINNEIVFDVPVCPNCYVDSLIYYSNIGETENDRQKMLLKIKTYMFN